MPAVTRPAMTHTLQCDESGWDAGCSYDFANPEYRQRLPLIVIAERGVGVHAVPLTT